MAPFYIQRLHLRDFRGFSNLDLVFPRGNVATLVGTNGSGKSTVLDAVAILLSRMAARLISSQQKGRAMAERDVRNEATVAEISCNADCEGHSLRWTARRVRSGGKGHASSDLTQLNQWAQTQREKLASEAHVSLPVLVHYSVNRTVLDIPLRIRKRHPFDQAAAYENALKDASSQFRVFFEWYRNREDVENERIRDDSSYRDRELEAVREAIARVLPGYGDLRVERRPLRMTLRKQGEKLRVDQLSDGEKCLLAMVGDMARRLALANPDGRPLDGAGVVLIDEIELHLHPAWQRRIIPALTETFANCQFILSTHSPAVLSDVPKDAVVLLERDGHRGTARLLSTYGKDANALLEDIFDTPPRAREVEEALDNLFRLIDEERYDEAQRMLASLKERVGPEDAAFARAEVLLWMPTGTS